MVSPRKKTQVKQQQNSSSSRISRPADVAHQDEVMTPPMFSIPSMPLDISTDQRSLLLGTNASSTSSESRPSTRSQSPQKHIGDTRLSTIPVERTTLTAKTEPKEFRELIHEIRLIKCGQKIIPRAVEEDFKRIGERLADFQKCDEKETQDDSDPHIFFSKALQVRDRAAECTHRRVSEARWNGSVHYAILDLSLEGYWKSTGVWYEDVTTARVTDVSLLPSVGGSAVRSKLVDLAIMIDSNSDEILEERVCEKIIRLGANSGQKTINCTLTEYVRFNPIAIAIETKRDVSSGDPYLQLGIWMTAHFLKLRQMVSSDTLLPSIPVLKVDGHRWFLLFASLKSRQTRDHLLLTGDIAIGSTESMIEIYCLVAALQRLAKWVHQHYRPWFEDNVLGSIP